MNNPVLVEVTRGAVVESRHRGAVCVIDGDGGTVLSLGDVNRPVFPRSAVKALQALPLIESGAADRFGLSADEIALSVASHSGEEAHALAAASMLKKAGRTPGCLECGIQWPMRDVAAQSLAARGLKPTALNNNCSGKHAGFVCLSCELGADPTGYIGADHVVQETVRGVMEDMTGAAHTPEMRGTDGCSIPTYAIPVAALAHGFAKFASGAGLGPERKKAVERIRAAVAAHPFMVAGTGRFDTRLMEVTGARVFTKTGAEGVYCAALPELGYGIALKCDDGAGRAAEVVMAALVARFLTLSPNETTGLEPLREAVMKNWNGIEVGRVRAAGALTG
jgi:L-asparaginase II